MNIQNDEGACELLNGQTCEILTEIRRLKEELQITREFIHDHGLEWALLTYYKRKEEETREHPKRQGAGHRPGKQSKD